MDKRFDYNEIKLTLRRYCDGSIGLAIMDSHDKAYKIYRLRKNGTTELEVKKPHSIRVATYQEVDLVSDLRSIINASEAEWLKTHPNKPTWGKCCQPV